MSTKPNHVVTTSHRTPAIEQTTAQLIRKYPGYSPHRVRNRALTLGMELLAKNNKLLLDQVQDETKTA